MSADDPVVSGMGMVSPVGLSAPASCAALRASVSGMKLLEGWADGEMPDPTFAAGRVPLEWMQPDFPYEWPGHEKLKRALPEPHLRVSPGAERLIELALPAAEEAWAAAGYAGQRGPGIGLYLGLDDDDEGTPIATAVSAALGVSFELVRRDRMGRAAGLAALHRAVRHLRDDRVRVAIVGGVDSRIRRACVAALLEQGRLKMEDVPDGLIPGEAAAFVVLESGANRGRGRVSVGETAIAEEESVRAGDPNRGVALTRVLRQTGGTLPDFPRVVGDLNGERLRHIEWALGSVRGLGRVKARAGGPTETEIWHPADCVGDTGAASGILNVVWAATSLQNGYALTDQALVWGASDGVLRGAAVLKLAER